jgi:uncharacterized protein YndB with AHSA1/START domain
MARQTIDVTAHSAASPEQVWRLLADVTTWPRWSGFDECGYAREGSPAPHGLGAVRRMRAGRLRSRETVLAFTPPEHFAYDYVGSLPVRDYRADVRLTREGSGTVITWSSTFVPKIPLTGPLLRRGLDRVVRDVSTRLARAAEAQPAAE